MSESKRFVTIRDDENDAEVLSVKKEAITFFMYDDGILHISLSCSPTEMMVKMSDEKYTMFENKMLKSDGELIFTEIKTMEDDKYFINVCLVTSIGLFMDDDYTEVTISFNGGGEDRLNVCVETEQAKELHDIITNHSE